MKQGRIILTVLGAVASVFLAGSARAQSAYLGADLVVLVNKLSYSILGNTYDETYGTGHLRLRAGFRVNENFAIEGHVLGANSNTSNDPFGTPYKMTTGPIAGVYGRLDLPVGEMSSFYGLIGVASVSTKYQRATATVGPEDTDKNTGLSLGFGFGIGLTESLKLNLDYMLYRIGTASYPHYFTGTPDQVVGGLGAGLSYQF